MAKIDIKVLRATCDHSSSNNLRVHLSDKDYDELLARLEQAEKENRALRERDEARAERDRFKDIARLTVRLAAA